MNFELLINISLEALKCKSSLCNHVIEGYRNSLQKQPSRCPFIKICPENMQQFYRRTPKPKCDLNKVTKQVYWNHTSALVLSCKFAAYFQNNFLQEHPWRAASLSILGSLQNWYSLHQHLCILLLSKLLFKCVSITLNFVHFFYKNQ